MVKLEDPCIQNIGIIIQKLITVKHHTFSQKTIVEILIGCGRRALRTKYGLLKQHFNINTRGNRVSKKFKANFLFVLVR